MRRRQIFAQRAMEAAQALKDFVKAGFTEESDPTETHYACECGKVFTTEHGLKVHKARAHK